MTDISSIHPLPALQQAGFRNILDLHFADMIGRAAFGNDFRPNDQEQFLLILAAALAGCVIRQGNSCIDLKQAAGQPLAPLLTADSLEEDAAEEDAGPAGHFSLPDWSSWKAALETPAARTVIGEDGEEKPLILCGSRLYLRRYRIYEQRIIRQIRTKIQTGLNHQLSETEEEAIEELFQGCNDRQKAAARSVLQADFSILSGGPGTGKTYTMARIIALLARLNSKERPLLISLAAPTGKAAVRMVESIRQAKNSLPCSPEVLRQIPEEATTIHRLLGARFQSPYFQHHAENPLTADMIVIDEASMIDLPMMAKLLDAIPRNTKLLLIGDARQLASVEPGRVFGDLCAIPGKYPEYAGILTSLTESRRFPPESDIGIISRAIESETPEKCWETACAHQNSFFIRPDHGPEWKNYDRNGDQAFRELVREGFRDVIRAGNASDALAAAGQFRVLCALHHGAWGITLQNRRIERILQEAFPDFQPAQPFYDHQLIMIQENTPQLQLFNGDIGIVLTGENGQLEAWFHDSASPDGRLKNIPVYMLPGHDTAFAMTVHKSQGSEFKNVALILPPGSDHPILTRELIYTGITRTREQLHLWCSEESFKTAVRNCTRRQSGLEL